MRDAAGAMGRPSTSSGSATLRSTVRQGSSAGSWKATPVRPSRRAASGDLPAISTFPESSGSRPSAARRIVDLPQPEGPISAVNDPGGQSSETSRSASTDLPRPA